MDRTRGIGGSDIAALMGISPWNTAYGVYQDKIQESKPVYQLSNPLRKITMTILTKSLLITALSVVNLSACALTGHEVKQINNIQAQDSQKFQDNLKAAQEGNNEAQYNLGVDYFHGLRAEKDDFQALKWFAIAAKAGHSGAQYYLGECYFQGLGTLEVDQEEALHWYQKAAAQGHQLAQIMVKQLTPSPFNLTNVSQGVPDDNSSFEG